MTTRELVMVVVVVVGLDAACGDEPYGELSVVTYNVGLAPVDVPLKNDRVFPIAQELAALDADVLCLQELWVTSDLDTIEAEGAYDTVVRHPDTDEVASCSVFELDRAQACIDEQCPGACGGALMDCLGGPCLAALPSGGCLGCGLGTATVCPDEIWDECSGSGSGEFLFSGYDTALLTRLPTLETDTLELSSTAVPTAVSFARVDSAAGPVDVYCAHFASTISLLEYAGPHGSWQGEREYQIQQTVDYIADKSGGSARVVLLGDLNDVVDAERLLPFEEAGLRSAAEIEEPGCTLCTDNTLVMRSMDKRVDHVYLGNRLAPVSFEVILDEPVSIDTADGPLTVHLSDHYGLRAVLSN